MTSGAALMPIPDQPYIAMTSDDASAEQSKPLTPTPPT